MIRSRRRSRWVAKATLPSKTVMVAAYTGRIGGHNKCSNDVTWYDDVPRFPFPGARTGRSRENEAAN